MTDLRTPTEIDSAIAEQLVKLAKAERDVATQESYRDSDSAYRRYSFDKVTYAKALKTLKAAKARDRELQALYTGWPRYWHVTNNNGHIHTSQSCTSCFPDTRYFWRTDLSGLTPEQVVEREAYNACSVCMPIAPAEQREARKRYTAEQKAARKAEKDQKANEKLRKAAERAQKLMVKVDAFYAEHGGYEAVMALDYPQLYKLWADLQSTVQDTIHDDHARTHGQYAFNKDPRKTIAEAREKGLIT